MKKLLLVAVTSLMLISTSSFALSSTHGYYVGCSSSTSNMWLWIIRATDTQHLNELFELCENQGGTAHLIAGNK